MRCVEDIILAYASAWNESDEARCRELVESCWAESGTVTGPETQYAGRDALIADIARFHRERPGYRAVFTSGLEAHHGFARFSVAVVDPSGKVVAEGLDVAEIGPDGRIARIITFWGALPGIPTALPNRLLQPGGERPVTK